ncbi:MAG: hypothetical protein RIB59_10415, partial [Rhodospirillales bacterium]
MKRVFMRRVFFTAALSVATAAADPASAQDSAGDLKQAVQTLRDQMKKMQSVYEGQIKKLETRLQTLEEKPEPQAVQAPRAAAGGASRVDVFSKQSPIQIGLSGNLISGGSSVGNEALGNLQRGDHDPKTNGFSVSNVELFVGGTVDPYFDAQANIALQIDSEGETKIELEEAFFTTRNLPGGLQVKGGQYFTEFGRANTQHPHSWSFVDQPVVQSRLLGADGLRSQGARVSWLTPLPWFSEFTLGAQNAKGETAAS